MGESLAAINIDQLTSAVTAAVNCSLPVSLSPPAPDPPCSLSIPQSLSQPQQLPASITTVSVGGIPVSSVPLMLSLQLSDKITGTPGFGDQTNSLTIHPSDPSRLTPLTASFPIPLSILPTQDVRPSSGQLLATADAGTLSQLTGQTAFPSLTNQLVVSTGQQCSLPDVQSNVSMALTLLSQGEGGISLPNAGGAGGQLGCLPTITDSYPIQSSLSPMFQFSSPPPAPQPSSCTGQTLLQGISFSGTAEAANLPSSIYMTSPISIVQMTGDQRDKGDNSALPSSPSQTALTLASMSVIDMLLKTNGADLPSGDEKVDDGEKDGEKDEAAIIEKVPALAGHYCVECNVTYEEPCKHHDTTYSLVADSPILSRARVTLPSCLYLQTSSVVGHLNSTGVYTKEVIPLRTKFGPLIGKPVPYHAEQDGQQENFGLCKIFFSDHCEALDIRDEAECNWLMFVKPARNSLEQNVVAFQEGAHIVFVTCKNIEPNTELLFWYGKDYAKLLGFSAKPRRLSTSYCPFCPICAKVFPHKKALTQHKRQEHSDAAHSKWCCSLCPRSFASSTKLNAHMIALHMGLKPYACSQCGKQFSDQSNLRMHREIHTGVKKFRCELCGKLFRQKAHLNAHMVTHSGAKDVKCQYCEKTFARLYDCKQHEYRHTKERVFNCTACSKVFYKLQNYKKHLRIHNNEKNYMCSRCSKTFYTRYHLSRHTKTCKGMRADMGVSVNVSTDADEELFRDLQGEGVGSIDMVSIVQDPASKTLVPESSMNGLALCDEAALAAQTQGSYQKSV